MLVLAAQCNPVIGDLPGNAKTIRNVLQRARMQGVDLVVFPEMVLTGYPPEDLLLDPAFILAVAKELERIGRETEGLCAVIGAPTGNLSGVEKQLFNSAVVYMDGKRVALHHKQLLPTYDVFDEKRYFEPGQEITLFEYLGKKIAITICEDLWQYSGKVSDTSYGLDPIQELQKQTVDLMINLSASPYAYERGKERLSVFSLAARAVRAPLIVCNQVGANDELIFDGQSVHLNEQGELCHIAKSFVEEDLLIDLRVRASPIASEQDPIEEMYQSLVLGVKDYFFKQGFQSALLGLSGGIDSALVACIAQEALGASNVLGVLLPSRYTKEKSRSDAKMLAEHLGIEVQEMGIEPIFEVALAEMKEHFSEVVCPIVEENLQPRIRSLLLMALSNQKGALLLNTGNKSEMALGYTTLYGDLSGALGVLHDVTKSNVYRLARFVNQTKAIIPLSILEKPPSAELKENQTDQEMLPPYEVLDPILEDYIEGRLSDRDIAKWRNVPLSFVQDLISQIHQAEYKRRQACIGLRVTKKAFSKGRQVPIVQHWK